MKGKDRAHLRAEAHHLSPMVHVGHHGLTDTLIRTLDDALRTYELVKTDISRNLDLTPKAAAHALATATNAEVIQVIGRKATLYRENPDVEWKDNIPPWR